ncbi:MAG: UDP-glucose 6-dehydrogenase [Candidatus Muproteobacteria bacterium RBG_19FT_COMBO_61_10]|jgi:UDPglucose 6-dehydrogenase|uniref:UDP-glucose 6-dehydrogenase n=1 Tax=Candidatus Muproteobacteria bacterium RBG_19FT_COMBO_61_10 TaxID=1817761 RepID=A0A1F6UN44_9PROT|nr:MAG: UDP-glucose 6-dehydrogenase [Candidatus Muproteobacteria bacterium RBG_19FT_COMBO_61_10]
MKLTIVGTGYVGLVTGACFAEMGYTVTCVDVDAGKIERLKQGILPIYEPGLEPIVRSNYKSGRLRFTTSLQEASADSTTFFIAVGTPPGENGSADLQYVLSVARDIGQCMSKYTIVVDKSTVPVGTADKVAAAIDAVLAKRGASIPYDVVSNPEFLKEGAAVDDFMRPDRIIIGCASDRARDIMRELYAPFNRSRERTVFMGVREAEMTKYAANAMLATKISFVNEIANLCDRLGVDVESVRHGIGSDTRIGHAFIYPGCGYGGSCFPKDVKALIHMAEENQFEPTLLNAVEARNEEQKKLLFRKITRRFGVDLQGRTFAIWGLAFKPGTDDMREAPSLVLLQELIAAGASVKAYDPVAMDSARREIPAEWISSGRVRLMEEQYAALDGADAMVLVTEWKPFRHPDFDRIKSMLKTPVIFDGRNQYDRNLLRQSGFEYVGIGR